jgi:hypothetical protein
MWDVTVKKTNEMTKWLFHYELREKRSPILWIVAAGGALAVLCVFGGLGAVQGLIERTEEFGSSSIQQGGMPFVVSKYSAAQMLVLGIDGVKYQLGITLALILRWSGLFAYRYAVLSARRKWLAIVIGEVSLLLAVATFAWYSWRSYRVLVVETVCQGCSFHSLLGSTVMWTSLLAFVMLVQTVYGIARLIVPLIDALRAKGTPTKA